MDIVRAMQVFSQVAEFGSFSKAAERLALPAATVTNTVQALERHLGVRLLHRTTRKVTLTEDGTLYLDRCTRLLADLEDTQALFAGPRIKPSGMVRVDLPERLARLKVGPALPDFFARYPDIQIKLGTTDRFVDLVGEGVDCAVRVGLLADSTLIARRIGEMEQINVASKDYLDRHGRPQHVADLASHVVVNYFSSRTGRDLGWEYVDDGQPRTLKLRSAVSVNSSDTYLACCRAGLGLIQVPRDGIEHLLASGELEEVLPAFRPAPLPVSVVYAHNRQMSPRVRVFVDWIAGVLASR
jgi:LysR family transcriptional regulator, regulator for bpeEF and oprC